MNKVSKIESELMSFDGMDALEATGSVKVINVDDTPMQIRLINDEMIKFNRLKEVSDPIMFEKGGVPTVHGLFSEYIFGTTSEERMRTYAYIDLRQKFFHPYVYEVLKKLYRNIDRIAIGESSWLIDKEGHLKEIRDENDPKFNPDNTGLKWLIDNFKKIKFDRNESNTRSDRIKFIDSLTDDELFITKWIVIPVFYRDVDMTSGRPSIPQLNTMYGKILKYVNSLSKDAVGFFNNKAMYSVQLEMVKIRNFGQSLIEKKHGAFHQSVLGKSIDHGVRLVISVPVLNNIERPSESQVNILSTGLPLADCLVAGYPFVMRWCLEFFRKEFDGVTKKTVYVKRGKNDYEMQEVEIADQMSIYTKDYIDKMMNQYRNTHAMRFDPIKITLANGKTTNMMFTGRGYSRNINDPKASTISKRAMTWTDLFYMAAVETLSDKHLYVTRYPLVDYFGIFPSRCTPLSTLKTSPVLINGKVYQYYPVIDPTIPKNQIGSKFIDTLEISNLYLSAIGGDYDGDQVSVKMVYTLEANEEAEALLNSIKHYVSIQGNIIRNVGNEAFLTFYNLTKY